MQLPLPILVFPDHHILPTVKYLAACSRKGVSSHLVRRVTVVFGLNRFERSPFDAHIHSPLPEGLNAVLPSNHITMGWEELPLLGVQVSETGGISASEG
jgi:hypothetical protein